VKYGWSLDKTVWEACIVAEGEWKKATLDPIKQDSIPPGPGVYAICARPTLRREGVFESLYEIIYVGRAKGAGGLRGRFLTHCNHPSARLQLAKDCFGANLDYWFRELEAEAVAIVESRLIQCLGPIVNQMGGIIEARIREPRPA
jgi:hypothetical protein